MVRMYLILNFVYPFTCSSVQFNHSVVSDSLRPQGLQHARPPCPSPTPGVYPNSCPLSRWCHQTISSSVAPFSHLQSFPTSGSFQMSQLFLSGAKVLEFQLWACFFVLFCFCLFKFAQQILILQKSRRTKYLKDTLPHQRSEVCLPMTYVWAAYSNCFLKSITLKGVKRITSW